MQTIWRYEYNDEPVDEFDCIEVDMPKDAKIIRAEFKDDRFSLWAIVDTEAENVTRVFEVIGTGWIFPDYLSADDYVSTTKDGFFVWHIFERRE